jgi:hypothetical protein
MDSTLAANGEGTVNLVEASTTELRMPPAVAEWLAEQQAELESATGEYEYEYDTILIPPIALSLFPCRKYQARRRAAGTAARSRNYTRRHGAA